ncbi:hypothetical protein OO012_16255 [Rhodobacteraceae bacterium KMM 6894]|nr:hypothetical protein [Rhodobacteraceae bacterium KMM 6894]
MSEKFPDIDVQDAIFTVDGRLFSSAGSASSMDLMLERIRSGYGGELSGWVADQMVYPAQPRHCRCNIIGVAQIGGPGILDI